MPKSMLLNGTISAEISCLYSVSANSNHAIKAPNAMESPANDALMRLQLLQANKVP